MLPIKRSAGVTPKVNLGNPLHMGMSRQPKAAITRNSKQGYQSPEKKDLCPPKIETNGISIVPLTSSIEILNIFATAVCCASELIEFTDSH